MSNRERAPIEAVCRAGATDPIDVLAPRAVPLGEPGAMTVRRTVPQRRRSLVGAWCFVDHYGPEPMGQATMAVPPHPHTCLQTVSWLFSGTIEHRDSAGHHALVRPGELNLMTAGVGISHSERSTPDSDVLHGVQLWVALPDHARFTDPRFEHHVPDTIRGDRCSARVFLGRLLGVQSPVATHTPLLGAEITVEPDSTVDLDVDPQFEHGILVDTGTVHVDAAPTPSGHLAYVGPGTASIRITTGAARSRILLLGGPPFGEQIVMWWNFIGRSHDEIVQFRNAWQDEIAAPPVATTIRYGLPDGDPDPPLPAPALPPGTLRARPR